MASTLGVAPGGLRVVATYPPRHSLRIPGSANKGSLDSSRGADADMEGPQSGTCTVRLPTMFIRVRRMVSASTTEPSA